MKYVVYKYNGVNCTYEQLYQNLITSVHAVCRNCYSQEFTEQFFAFMLTELSTFGKVYCNGNKFQLCYKKV